MDWKPIETHPIDGSTFDVLCQHGAIVEKVFYGFPPISEGKRVLRGTQNVLSPHLTVTHWRKQP